MHRSVTRRALEEDGDDELGDSFDGDDVEFRNNRGSVLHGGPPFARGREPSLDASSSSLRMTMTPTMHYLEQPVVLERVPSRATAPTSTVHSRVYHDPMDSHRGTRLNGTTLPPGMDEELAKITYETPHLRWMVAAALVGVAAGVVLNRVGVGVVAQQWIGEVGALYVNVLECLALPLIFTSVTIGVAHLVVASKTGGVMLRMGLMFATSAFLAAGLGMLLSFVMSPTYRRREAPSMPPPSAALALQCPNELYLTAGSTKCEGKQFREAMLFVATNITGIALQNPGDDYVDQGVSYVTQIVAFFSRVFQQNITEAFAQGEFLGVIVFASFIGAGLVVSQDYADAPESSNYLFLVLKQLDLVLAIVLNWLIRWIPLGTVSAMAYSIMTGTVTSESFRETLYLPLTLLIALVVHFGIICVGYFVLIRKNPLHFFWYLMPALVFVFASGNYVATVPVMMRSVESSQQVSRTLAQLTLSVGTALSLCGHAAFFVVACVYMVYTSGLEDTLTAGRVLLLIVTSALSSFGTPQAPGASLTYVATIYRTVFGAAPPSSFVYLVWVEWLTVRMRRVHNVTVVAFTARIIAEQLDEGVEDEEDRALATTRGLHSHSDLSSADFIAPL